MGISRCAAIGVLTLAAGLRGGIGPAVTSIDAQVASPWESWPLCTERVSVASDGSQADGVSQAASLSADGRLVSFGSLATNLVAGDQNGNWDIFLHDRATGETRQVTFSPPSNQDGRLGAGDSFLSADGSFVSYAARAGRAAPGDPLQCTSGGGIRTVECILVLERSAGDLRPADFRPDGQPGNGFSRWAALSGDGGLVAFWSHSSDLLAGDSNGVADVFVHDSATGITERASVSSLGVEGDAPSGDVGRVGADAVSVSTDGRYVVFASHATNLVPGDANGRLDLFLRDRQTGLIEIVNRAADGGPADAEAASRSRQAISDDGSHVVFASAARDLVRPPTGGGMQVFVRDRIAGANELASVASDGSAGNGPSTLAAISADGRYVAFSSAASNLVAGDTNRQVDIFVRDRVAGRTVRASVATTGDQADDRSASQTWEGLALSADGLTVAWSSHATNLVPGDTNGSHDIFVRHPCEDVPTVTPIPSPTSTPSPAPTASPSPTPAPTATPTATAEADCICAIVRRRVPPEIIDDARYHPERYYGWRNRLDPGKPSGPANPPRMCLTLRNVNLDYHPLWNAPVWRVGCP